MGIVRAMYARAGLALGVFRFADRGNFCAFEGTRGIRGAAAKLFVGGGRGVGRAGREGGRPVFFRTIGPVQGLQGYAGEGTPPCIMRPRCAPALCVRVSWARFVGAACGPVRGYFEAGRCCCRFSLPGIFPPRVRGVPRPAVSAPICRGKGWGGCL